MNDNKSNIIIFLIVFLATLALFLEHSGIQNVVISFSIHAIDFIVIFLFFGDVLLRFIKAKYKRIFIRKNILEILFLFCFILLFLYSKYISFLISFRQLKGYSINAIFLMNIFIAIKIFTRVNKLQYFFKKFSKNPAQTIVVSFFILILVGTLLLMMPFATDDHTRLGFINAFFTATSAVCVTGLIVVDTATRFSFIGQMIILVLIQCGGLGIMFFSYFIAFIVGRRISFEEKLTFSYIMDEKDMQRLSHAVANIIAITFIIEGIGAACLFLSFKKYLEHTAQTFFFSVFHSVSAFCNAGFALFTDSLELFKSSFGIAAVIAVLIILGGAGFTTIINVYEFFIDHLKSWFTPHAFQTKRLTLNTKVVLIISGFLILAGGIIIYGFEHRCNLVHYDIMTQYYAAFFQSITLRTAGFNTIPIGNLHASTYLVMMLWMFIGAASGSTGGGIKVNTIAVMYGYIKSVLKNTKNIVLFKQSISRDLVNRSFLIVIMALAAIVSGIIVLSRTEQASILRLAFEAVSAFCTVGLSTGITSSLTAWGKLVIIILMYIGRIGPLTIIAALVQRKTHAVEYPSGYLAIG